MPNASIRCFLCQANTRKDRLKHHIATHKTELKQKLDPLVLNSHIKQKIPMINGVNNRGAADEFCVCLICEQGCYKGGHGDVQAFYVEHRQSECMQKWDSVAHYFTGAGVPKPVKPKPSSQYPTLIDIMNHLNALEAKLDRLLTNPRPSVGSPTPPSVSIGIIDLLRALEEDCISTEKAAEIADQLGSSVFEGEFEPILLYARGDDSNEVTEIIGELYKKYC